VGSHGMEGYSDRDGQMLGLLFPGTAIKDLFCVDGALPYEGYVRSKLNCILDVKIKWNSTFEIQV